MATPSEVHLKQRAVIEFLVAERETTVNIHKRLQTVYKDKTLDYSNVWRWTHRLITTSENSESQELGNASLRNKPRAGRQSTSVNPANKTKAGTVIRADRRITIDEFASVLGVSHGSAHNIVESLEYSKVCAR